MDIVKESAKSLLQSVLKQLCGLETTSKKIMYMERFVYLLRYDSKDMIPISNVPFLSTKAKLDFTIYKFYTMLLAEGITGGLKINRKCEINLTLRIQIESAIKLFKRRCQIYCSVREH